MDHEPSHESGPLTAELLRKDEDGMSQLSLSPLSSDAQPHRLSNIGTVHVLIVEDDVNQQIMLKCVAGPLSSLNSCLDPPCWCWQNAIRCG